MILLSFVGVPSPTVYPVDPQGVPRRVPTVVPNFFTEFIPSRDLT